MFFQAIPEDEYEGPPTLNDPLLFKLNQQSYKEYGPMPIGLAFRSSRSFITFVVCMAVFTVSGCSHGQHGTAAYIGAGATEDGFRNVFLEAHSRRIQFWVYQDSFSYTIIIPILPFTLTENAKVPEEDIQYWTSILVSAFGAANLFVSPLAGHFTDITSSRRTPLLWGLYSLTISTLMYFLGTTPLILVISRALQGASAAVIWVVGMALLSDTMGASSTGGAMGWPGIGRFLGSLLGPSLGGIVYDFAGHYAVFAMAFTVLFFDIVLRFVMIERKVAEQWLVLDGSDGYGTCSSIPTPVNGISDPNAEEQSRPEICESRVIACSASSVTSKLEPENVGIMPLLKNPRILAAISTYFVCSVLMTAVESVLSLYTMILFNWKPAQSGLIFVMVTFSIISNPIVGRLTDKHGCRGMTVAGILLGVLVWLALALVTTDTLFSKSLLAFLLFLLGFSSALMVVPNMVEISSAVEAIGNVLLGDRADPGKVMGRAYSFLNMSWGLGSIVGPLWAGAVIEKWGWVVMCMTFVVLQIFGAWFAWMFAGERGGEVGAVKEVVEGELE